MDSIDLEPVTCKCTNTVFYYEINIEGIHMCTRCGIFYRESTIDNSYYQFMEINPNSKEEFHIDFTNITVDPNKTHQLFGLNVVLQPSRISVLDIMT